MFLFFLSISKLLLFFPIRKTNKLLPEVMSNKSNYIKPSEYGGSESLHVVSDAPVSPSSPS